MKLALSCLLVSIFTFAMPAQAVDTVRVGVLQFGTVNWEMAVIQRRGLDGKHGVDIQVVPLSSKNAVNVALQGKAVDMIVSDWIWVNRQRATGRDYSFFPYSLTVGGLYVRPDAKIAALSDLKGRKLGIAGGPVDKSWLLLQALARTQDLDLADDLEPTFAAPPLLNRLMLKGDLPAVLNFWHYGARLQAAGMRPLIDVSAMLQALGITEPVPMLGWIFSESWAVENPKAILGFLAASYEAKGVLDRQDDEWLSIRELTKAKDDATLGLLCEGYRLGIPRNLIANGEQVAGKVFDILAREGGARLVGDARKLLPGTFWSGLDSAKMADAPIREN